MEFGFFTASLAFAMRSAILSIVLVSSPVLAQVGFYKLSEPPGISRTWGEMCIKESTNGSFNVELFGGYCPTVGSDCANMHFDDFEFEAKPRKGVLLYKDNKCKFRIELRKNGARAVQKGHCGAYDLFAGRYVKRASEVWADDCSPHGSDETHHK